MANITKAGTGGAVKVGTETVAELRSWSVEESADTVEDTNMGSGGVRSYKTTHKTWTASADVYIAYDSASSNVENFTTTLVADTPTVATITVGTEYSWSFYAEVGGEAYTGTGIVTGVSRSQSHDGMAEMSVSIQGNSALT